MEHENEQTEQTGQMQEPYVERPRWQVWGARIGLVLMLLFLALYYYHIARGGA